MSARILQLAMLALLVSSVEPAAAWSQSKQAQTKTVTPPNTQQKAVTTPAPQQKAATPPAAQQKTVTPPATQQKAPVTQQKTAQPPATQQQKTAPPQTKGAAPQTKGAAPQTKTPPGTKTPTVVAAAPSAAARDSIVASTMMREVYDYSRDGRRDPFISLLATTDLRPTLSDLRLLMTVVDEPGRSVALVQDSYDKKAPQKTLRIGQRLGRMRVASIRSDAVVFTIEEFGMNRRDSLLLRDSTKARVGR